MNTIDTTCLTKGALNDILRGINVEKPIVKITEIVKITSHNGEDDRYRVCLFDGETSYPVAILSAHLHLLVLNKDIKQFSVIQILEYKTQLHPIGQKQRLIINVLRVNVLNNDSQPVVITSNSNAIRDHSLLGINQWKSHINDCKKKIHHLKIVYNAEKNKTTMHQKQQQQIDGETQRLIDSLEGKKIDENCLITEMNELRCAKSMLKELEMDAEEVVELRLPRPFDYYFLNENINNINRENDGPPPVKKLKASPEIIKLL